VNDARIVEAILFASDAPPSPDADNPRTTTGALLPASHLNAPPSLASSSPGRSATRAERQAHNQRL